MPLNLLIGIVGDQNAATPAHVSIPLALAQAGLEPELLVKWQWVPTHFIHSADDVAQYDAIWCAPGSPYRSAKGALTAIRHARESGTPFLGTCGGFQHAVLEYAQNVLGLAEAAHAESNPGAEFHAITPLGCSLVGQTGDVFFTEGSRIAAAYGARESHEAYHCNYGFNPAIEAALEESDMQVTARDAAGAVRAVELRSHPFFIGTLFQPERALLYSLPCPLAEGLVRAAAIGARAPAPASGTP
ncbi:MAG TPA: gamma-glutamyl-gamma-aminobutyrate hydrolase family protein [Fimbriimonadaceae bacterium]|nr:gamma-glutamyl-gamma-aminobutyrate hydrolase family protein [Fimbriimonadaceae bacterium]